MTNTDEGPHRLFKITEADIAQAQKDKERMRSMTDKGLLEKMEADIALAEKQLGELCESGGRTWRLSIPVQPTDTDTVYANLIRHAKELLSIKQHQPSVEAAPCNEQPVELSFHKVRVAVALLNNARHADNASHRFVPDATNEAIEAALKAVGMPDCYFFDFDSGESTPERESSAAESTANQPSGDVVFSALKRLVDLKAHKDKCGKTLYYEEQQPQAWEQAIAAMSLGEVSAPVNPIGNDTEAQCSEGVAAPSEQETLQMRMVCEMFKHDFRNEHPMDIAKALLDCIHPATTQAERPVDMDAFNRMKACCDEYEALEFEKQELESENEILIHRIAKIEDSTDKDRAFLEKMKEFVSRVILFYCTVDSALYREASRTLSLIDAKLGRGE